MNVVTSDHETFFRSFQIEDMEFATSVTVGTPQTFTSYTQMATYSKSSSHWLQVLYKVLWWFLNASDITNTGFSV